jgi:hypothetical protein
MHGWQPAGTEPPQWDEPGMQAAHAEQPGYYTSVTGADAQALAQALERALPTLADKEQGAGTAAALAAGAFVAGPDQRWVKAFIAFARAGKFSIRPAPEPGPSGPGAELVDALAGLDGGGAAGGGDDGGRAALFPAES